jgi:hypothetical protein
MFSKIEIKIIGMNSENSFQIRSKNTEAIDGKLIEKTHYSVIYKANASMFQKMTLENFQTYKSILPLKFINHKENKTVHNYLDSNLEKTNLKQGFYLSFEYEQTMTEHDQYPENLESGITQFGGWLAFLEGAIFVMDWINRRQFERKLTKFLHKEKLKAEALQEPSLLVASSHAGDVNRRKTFSIQDEEDNDNDSLLNKSTTLSQPSLPTTEEGEIKKRYSIEMFEEIIQAMAIQRQEIAI